MQRKNNYDLLLVYKITVLSYPADKAAKVYGDTKISNLDFVFIIYLKVKAGVLTIFTMPAFFMYPRPSVSQLSLLACKGFAFLSHYMFVCSPQFQSRRVLTCRF